ncbi:MAG: Rieske (2Fe-2S) protein [Acidobacteria bacterium]|nr:Rieske (2Fe-2S) protein [Acidobacteriota bacterium]
MPFVKVAALVDVPAGSMMEVHHGEARIAVCNIEGQLHAIDGVCPHRQGPLAHGALHGTMVVCPWHAWEFDCVTGQNDYDPRLVQRKYSVKAEDGHILVDLD